MSREQAVQLVKLYDAQPPEEYYDEFCVYLMDKYTTMNYKLKLLFFFFSIVITKGISQIQIFCFKFKARSFNVRIDCNI